MVFTFIHPTICSSIRHTHIKSVSHIESVIHPLNRPIYKPNMVNITTLFFLLFSTSSILSTEHRVYICVYILHVYCPKDIIQTKYILEILFSIFRFSHIVHLCVLCIVDGSNNNKFFGIGMYGKRGWVFFFWIIKVMLTY